MQAKNLHEDVGIVPVLWLADVFCPEGEGEGEDRKMHAGRCDRQNLIPVPCPAQVPVVPSALRGRDDGA